MDKYLIIVLDLAGDSGELETSPEWEMYKYEGGTPQELCFDD